MARSSAAAVAPAGTARMTASELVMRSWTCITADGARPPQDRGGLAYGRSVMRSVEATCVSAYSRAAHRTRQSPQAQRFRVPRRGPRCRDPVWRRGPSRCHVPRGNLPTLRPGRRALGWTRSGAPVQWRCSARSEIAYEWEPRGKKRTARKKWAGWRAPRIKGEADTYRPVWTRYAILSVPLPPVPTVISAVAKLRTNG